jgi:starvation-inducible DNA-binding protein
MPAPPEKSNPLLPDDVTDEVGKQLQLTLVELIALSLAGRQLSWNAYGREFLSVHEHLDQAVAEWWELGDAVAERTVVIGVCPDGTPAAIIELADLRPVDPGFTEAGAAIERMCIQLWEVALRVRQRSEMIRDLDAVSHNVLVGVSQTLEKRLWMMRAQLPD